MTGLSRRLTIVATALLALAIVAVLIAQAPGGRPVAEVPTPTPLAATSTPGLPSPTASEEALDVFARIEEQVSAMRGLPQADIGPPEVISRRQLADELRAIFDVEWSPQQLADDNLTLRAMGLLTAEQDIRELTETLYAGQVLGFYDFEERRMVVVTDRGLTAEARITYAHEFTHAMQDAAFDTGEAHQPDAEDDDAALALLALEEGDATVAMFQWAFQNLSPEELAEVGGTPLPDTTGIPPWMIRQLQFPYLDGATFVTQLWGSGDWQAVDAAYEDPPASTEQVLHPDKYLDREPPLRIADPRLAALMGDGWRSVESSTIGEAMLAIWLEHLGADTTDADAAAAGWGGDRLSVARGPNGQWAMAWRIAWDAGSQADDFDDAYAQVSDGDYASAMQAISATERLVLHASSASTLDALQGALGG